MAQSSFEAIGTIWSIDIYDDLPDGAAVQLFTAINHRIDAFDQTYSRFRPDSVVSSIARKAGIYTLPEDATPMLTLYRQFYELTNGAMTPLIGQLLSDSGYDVHYSLKPKAGPLPAVPTWDDAMTYEPETHQLTTVQPLLLDFGAAGKGYLVDLVSELIEAQGVVSYCVDAGGDIRQRNVGPSLDRIGLEHPLVAGQVLGVASPGSRSLCGSATNRRTWPGANGEQLHHILDPRSQRPATGIAGLWTVASTTMLADALATAIFFVSPQRLQAEVEFEYAVLYDSPIGADLHYSAGFPAEFFTPTTT